MEVVDPPIKQEEECLIIQSSDDDNEEIVENEEDRIENNECDHVIIHIKDREPRENVKVSCIVNEEEDETFSG